MSKDDVNADPSTAADPARRDKALKVARVALADASQQLETAANNAGNIDETHADLNLLCEEARDVYTRVAALSLRFGDVDQHGNDSGQRAP